VVSGVIDQQEVPCCALGVAVVLAVVTWRHHVPLFGTRTAMCTYGVSHHLLMCEWHHQLAALACGVCCMGGSL
jgi:hypothetical protein